MMAVKTKAATMLFVGTYPDDSQLLSQKAVLDDALIKKTLLDYISGATKLFDGK